MGVKFTLFRHVCFNINLHNNIRHFCFHHCVDVTKSVVLVKYLYV